MDQETKDKVAKLPAWAQQLIKRLETANEPAANEVWMLRQKVEQLNLANRNKQNRIEAMVMFFQCAAKGENEVAKAVKSIVEDFLISDEE